VSLTILGQDSGMARPKKIVAVVLLLAVTAAAFASTKLRISWQNPNYARQRYTTILAIGMSNNLQTRADFEVALARKIARPGITAIAGADILLRPTAGKLDLPYLREQIKAFNVDAVVVSRLVKVDTNVTYVPGQAYFLPYYNSFYGFYGTVYPVVYSPGYLQKDTTVRVETNLYAVTEPEGVLLWTGMSDTFNPSSAHKVIDGLVKLVVKEFEDMGIISDGDK
jgi:hypothetical protein